MPRHPARSAVANVRIPPIPAVSATDPFLPLATVAKPSLSSDAKRMDEAQAKRIIETHVSDLPSEEGWTYSVVSSREHPLCWAFGVQPLNSKGQPSYDILGFEVDKRTGAVTQWT